MNVKASSAYLYIYFAPKKYIFPRFIDIFTFNINQKRK